MSEFDEIMRAQEIADFKEIESPLVVDASVSAGFMVHRPDCDCGERETTLIVINLKFVGDERLEFCVPVDSPLGRALTTGEMQERCLDRLSEIA